MSTLVNGPVESLVGRQVRLSHDHLMQRVLFNVTITADDPAKPYVVAKVPARARRLPFPPCDGKPYCRIIRALAVKHLVQS